MPRITSDSIAPPVFDLRWLTPEQHDLLRYVYPQAMEGVSDTDAQAFRTLLEAGFAWWDGTDKALLVLLPKTADQWVMHFAAKPRGGLDDAVILFERFLVRDWPTFGYPELTATTDNFPLQATIRFQGRRLAMTRTDVTFEEPEVGSFRWRHHA